MDTKRCSRCGEQLPLSRFRRHAQNAEGYISYCKACMVLKVDVPPDHKQCQKCGEIKPLREFHKKAESPDGYRNHCKLCRSGNEGFNYKKPAPEGFRYCSQCGELKPANHEYFSPEDRTQDRCAAECRVCAKADYWKNRKKYLQPRREFYRENKDEINRIRRETYRKNPEKVLNWGRAWASRNPEKIREGNRRYYYENFHILRIKAGERQKKKRHVIREWRKKWYRENLERERNRAQTIRNRRKAIEANLPSNFTRQDWNYALEYFGYCCVICGRKAGEELSIAMDHWIPLSDPRPDNLGTVPENIVPLCHGIGGCNNEKHNFDAKEWLIRKLGEEAGLAKLAEIEAYFQHLRDRKSNSES